LGNVADEIHFTSIACRHCYSCSPNFAISWRKCFPYNHCKYYSTCRPKFGKTDDAFWLYNYCIFGSIGR